MYRRLLTIWLLTLTVTQAATRLYLKDGTFQLVREYKIEGDRIKYYSSERADWEELPLELADLKRTQSEAAEKEQALKEEAKTADVEEKAERASRAEVDSVPQDFGVYWVTGGQLKTIPAAETKIVNDKRRNVWRALSPIPIVSGKGTLEVDGEHSKNAVDSDLPEFYIRLSAEERFGIVRLAARKGNRVVEELQIIPVSKEIVEKQDEVQVFRRQVADGLYKIWPMKPIEPGEYAVVQYHPANDGSLSVQTWDFSWPGKR